MSYEQPNTRGTGAPSPWKIFRQLTEERQKIQGQYADCKTELNIAERHPDLYPPEEVKALIHKEAEVIAVLREAAEKEEEFSKAHPEVLQPGGNPETEEPEWKQELQTNNKGQPYACLANIAIILRNVEEYKDKLRFNLFSGHIEFGPQMADAYGRIQTSRQWTDTDDYTLASYLLKHFRMVVTSPVQCTHAVLQVAHEAEYDPILSWLKGLPAWDGVDRLSSFFEDYCEVSKDAYSQHCGRILFLSLVARAYRPGCQVDTTIVLQGPEGARKTSLCRILGGPWFREITLSFESKDFYQALARTWLGELAELDSFKRSEQTRIKAMLTTTEDIYRASYGRYEVAHPRRAVFIGTTNDFEFLVDPHGGRRFFPVSVGMINLEAVSQVLLQLFAEARERFERGESWWEESAEVRGQAVVRREIVREIDPWESTIAMFCERHPGNIQMVDILGSLCLNIPTERQTRAQSTRAGVILHKLGYVKTRPTNPTTGNREYVYVKE